MAEERITQYQLADALKGMRLAVRTDDGGLVNGEIHVPDNVALHVFRSVGAEHPTGPRTKDADLCASCGNQFKPGQLCDSCRTRDPWADDDDVVDAHICCDHVLGSLGAGELDAMDKIAVLLRHRTERSRRRVLNWAKDYLLDRDEPPF